MGKLSDKASDPATTPGELEKLWNENKKRWDTREEGLLAIARNPRTPLKVLDEMIEPQKVSGFVRGDPTIEQMLASQRRIATVASGTLRKRESMEQDNDDVPGVEKHPASDNPEIQALKARLDALEKRVKMLEEHRAL